MRAIKDRVEVLKWKMPHTSTRTLIPPSGRCVATTPKQTNSESVHSRDKIRGVAPIAGHKSLRTKPRRTPVPISDHLPGITSTLENISPLRIQT